MSDVPQAVLHNTEDGMYYHTTYLEQSGAQRHKAKESKWSITSIVQHQIHTQTHLAGGRSPQKGTVTSGGCQKKEHHFADYLMHFEMIYSHL